MKISAKQYAQSLFELTDGKTEHEVKTIILDFVAFLSRQNNLSLADNIIEQFSQLWNTAHDITDVEVKSAHKLNEETSHAIEKFLHAKIETKKIVLRKKIDKNILGGTIIKFGDRVLDGSLKTKLGSLKNELIK